jgi:hypothetical protein
MVPDGRPVNYLAVSLQSHFSDTPHRLVVTGRFGEDEE